jgi:hypothetical protein
MDKIYFQLPDIITLEEFGGDITTYFNEVYNIFKKDFVDSRPIFEGRRLGLKSHPLIENKEYTFYHFTHDGDIESERLPNLRRMERIRFPRPMIDHCKHPYLKIWRNKRGSKKRILIFHEDESYLVVLEDRGKYILPWTAYWVQYENMVEKLLAEYEAFKKAEAAR